MKHKAILIGVILLLLNGCALSVKPTDGDRTRDCYRQASYGDASAYSYANCKR